MTILCTIDLLTREVFLPADQRIAAYDHNVDVVHFQAEPVEDFSFDTSSIRIAAKGPNKARHDYPVDPSTVAIEEETGYITFDWPIPAGVTEMPEDMFGYGSTGQLIFAVCAEIISGSTLSKAWHSDDGIITVVAHLEPEAGGGEDPEEEATNRQMIGQLQTDVAVINTQIGALGNGSPTPAGTVAEMTEHDKVYLYTGSEPGYTAGNWYYYNGSAWTSGGTYGGAVTDTTLSISGAPADAKAVGDAIAEKADADDVTALDDRVTALESDTSGGLTADIKSALLACFAHVAWDDDDPSGQSYISALDAALNPPAGLVSISAVYTQSGTVYDTASLDDLKPDLVVTARYDNATTQVITNYALSGTLTEGTSTITVTFGGKTTTFNVTVSVFNTAPVILATDTQWKSDYTQGAKTGLCITDWYSCDVDYDALKATSHYDSTNDYMTWAGDIFWIVTHFPNSQGISLSGNGRSVAFFDVSGEEKHAYASCLASGDSKFQSGRQNSNYMHADNGHFEFSFTLASADVDDSYAYWSSIASGVMPVGVTAGDIIFAGRNTPYWGCSNISEASS